MTGASSDESCKDNLKPDAPVTPRTEKEVLSSSSLRKFSFNDLKSATRNFRPDSLLGEGGFGYVFKGWVEENGTAPMKPGTGLVVAVKILNPNGLQGHKEWLVVLHSKHINAKHFGFVAFQNVYNCDLYILVSRLKFITWVRFDIIIW